MKRREAKFVAGSSKLASDQIEAAPHVRERERRKPSIGRGLREETARAVRLEQRQTPRADSKVRVKK